MDKNIKKLITLTLLTSLVLTGCSNEAKDNSEISATDSVNAIISVETTSETTIIPTEETSSSKSSEIIPDETLISTDETESLENISSSDEKLPSSENDSSENKKEPEINNSEESIEKKPESTKPTSEVSNGKSIHLDDSFKSIDPANCFTAPSESDFGEHYDKAIAVYNAIINKQETIEIVFDVEGTSDSISSASTEVCGKVQKLWENFRDTFNSKVLNNTVKLETFQESYYSGKIIIWSEKIYPYLEENLTSSDIYYESNISAGLYNGMSEKEAVKAINSWICKKLSYSESNTDAATAVKTGKGNCAAYAELFEGMCNNAGIQNRYHSGFANNGSFVGAHAWNSVCLEGTWYYVVVCWNDTTNNKYLLISEEQINKDHNV